MNTYKYQVGMGPVYEFISSKSLGYVHGIAQDAAENYHYCHGGFDGHWPLVFIVYSADMAKLGTFEVRLEVMPHFTANLLPIP